MHLILWDDLFALCLLAACVSDVAQRRIPNLLCLLTLVGAWGCQAAAGGTPAMWGGVRASALAGSLLLALHVAGAVAPGDVKFFAAAAGFLPPSAVPGALVLATTFGGVLASGILLHEVGHGVWRHAPTPAASRAPPSSRWTRACVLLWTQAHVALAARRRAPDEAVTVPYAVALSWGLWQARAAGWPLA